MRVRGNWNWDVTKVAFLGKDGLCYDCICDNDWIINSSSNSS